MDGKDYILQVRVKNGPMLRALRASGYPTVAALSRASGVSAQQIGLYLNLKSVPLKQDGAFREDVQTIAAYLHADPEDLFPPQHLRRKLATNTGETEVSTEEITSTLVGASAELNQHQLLERRDLVARLVAGLCDLNERERKVLTMRYGLTGDGEHTHRECGAAIGVSGVRAQQIEAKALRKLGHPAAGIADRDGRVDLSLFG